MSLTSYRAAPPRVGEVVCGGDVGLVGGPGGDLLSRALRRSTMGAAGFHGRVRNGIGWDTRAIGHQVDEPARFPPFGGAGRGDAASRFGMGPGVAGLRLSLMGVEVIRAIRTGQLSASPRLHIRPIDVVVYHGSDGETWFCGRFPA